jgi:hypothetical protein
MPFTGSVYTRFKSFVGGGAVYAGDLNGIQDDLGAAVSNVIARAGLARTTTLPTTGLIDGMIVPWQPSDAAAYGAMWLMKYNASAPSYKWEFVGGGERMSAVEGPGQIYATDGFSTLRSNNTQDFVIPAGGTGDWRVTADCAYVENRTTNPTGNVGYMHVQPCVVGVEGDDANKAAGFQGAPFGVAPFAGYGSSVHRSRLITCSANQTLGVRYSITGTTLTPNDYMEVRGKNFSVVPIHVTG